jgi:hypothetical protein
VPSPGDHVPNLTDDLALLVQRMLAKNPAQRPQTFADFLAEPALYHSYLNWPIDAVAETRPTAFWHCLLGRHASPTGATCSTR